MPETLRWPKCWKGTVAAGAADAVPEAIGKGYGAVVTHAGLTKEALLPPPVLIAPGKVQVDPLVRLTYETGVRGEWLSSANREGTPSFTEGDRRSGRRRAGVRAY